MLVIAATDAWIIISIAARAPGPGGGVDLAMVFVIGHPQGRRQRAARRKLD